MTTSRAILLILLAIGPYQITEAVTLSYKYDTAGRLATASVIGSGSTRYGYDSNGNLLSAVSTTNLIAPLFGKYAGLVAGPGSSVSDGVLSLTLTASGAFTGSAIIAGKRLKLKGQLDANGDAAIDLPGSSAAHLALHLNPATQQIQGVFTGGLVGTFTAAAAPFGKKNPAPAVAVGKLTGLFAATQSIATVPKGTGFASVTISSSGNVKLAGVLAEETRFSQGSTLVS